MSFLRYLMLLSLIVWVGGLIFFAFVVAPTAFAVLPTRHLAGNVVGRSINALHWMGIVAGLIYLACSVLYNRFSRGTTHIFTARHVLICLMLVLTLISQFVVSAKMAALRAAMGEIDLVPIADARRIAFNQLHAWSTRLESGVLILGLIVLFLVARRLS